MSLPLGRPLPSRALPWQDLPQTKLPNGLGIRYVSRRDVPFLYPETVGPEGRVICMEPIPNAAAALQHNIQSHQHWCLKRGVHPGNVSALNVGAGNGQESSATFTCYPDAAGWSTMQPNDAEVQEGVASYLQNSLRTRAGLEGSLLVSLASLLQRLLPRWLTQRLFRWFAGRMLAKKQQVSCELTSISAVIRQQQLDRVHLMKIDVERAELDVLRGVEAQHWQMIDQVVAEVHDIDGSLEKFQQILRNAAFTSLRCSQDPALSGTTMFLVAASRAPL
ncbi:hypothetical protein WJX74_008922 [Apatococcus lobatus]|uniref:Methyltransferase FkbM domain-containing protein n=1 Tax=Apatococcus lobatus TaxID=904363 RepID=A0AAW1RX64_9CHLO